MSLGNLQVAIDCESCGKNSGTVESGGRLRCSTCGRFGQETDEYCMVHEVDYSGIYPEDNHCPYCREERHVEEMRQHEMTRDPQVEPW